jgi:rare lipoprotein A (peptidoglycan hydrolase)
MRKLVIGCAVAGLIALSPRSEARLPASIISPPLVVPRAEPKCQVGVASWYGQECEGNPTASGEVFDMYGFTAAHPTLPLGTTVRVTNLKNSRSILLRVNDRGPGIDGRIIDVSWEAAMRLGFVNCGLTPVQVEVVRYPKLYHPEMARLHFPGVN